MNAQNIALKLIHFLNQKEDFETRAVLKHFILDAEPTSKPAPTSLRPTFQPHQDNKIKPTQTITQTPSPPPVQVKENPIAHTLSIYTKLVDKIKKACPELRIKEHFDMKKAGIPDCDVVLLSEKTIPDVYNALVKAIDKQLALTEIVVMDTHLMADLLTKHYKLVLAPPFLKQNKQFMTHIKVSLDGTMYHLGSSHVLFLEDPNTLTTTLTAKQRLWQTIKTLLS